MLLVDASFLFVVLSFHHHFVGTPDINSKGNNKNALSVPINVISSPWGIHNLHPRTKSSTVKVIEVSDLKKHFLGVLFPISSDCCGSSLFSGIAIRLHFDHFGKNKHPPPPPPPKKNVAVGGRFNFSICGVVVCLSSKCFYPTEK